MKVNGHIFSDIDRSAIWISDVNLCAIADFSVKGIYIKPSTGDFEGPSNPHRHQEKIVDDELL